MKLTQQNFWVFLPLFTLAFGCFGMIGANFSSLALEPLGKIAGYAAAVYGTATSTISAWIGFMIARQFDGTVYPILIGFICMGLMSRRGEGLTLTLPWCSGLYRRLLTRV